MNDLFQSVLDEVSSAQWRLDCGRQEAEKVVRMRIKALGKAKKIKTSWHLLRKKPKKNKWKLVFIGNFRGKLEKRTHLLLSIFFHKGAREN